MITREDSVRIIYRKDRSHLVEYDDDTRITTLAASHSHSQQRSSHPHSHNNKSRIGKVYQETSHHQHQRKEIISHIKVECPGYATTVFDTASKVCTLVFGNGLIVECDPDRMTYSMSNTSGDSLDIAKDGVVTYVSK